jgi:hypothetical protein
VEVEVAMALVKVLVEAKSSSGARRYSAQEAYRAQAPPGTEQEELVSVPAPYGIGTPAPAWRSMQGAPGPRVVRAGALGPRVAREKAPETVVHRESLRKRENQK